MNYNITDGNGLTFKATLNGSTLSYDPQNTARTATPDMYLGTTQEVCSSYQEWSGHNTFTNPDSTENMSLGSGLNVGEGLGQNSFVSTNVPFNDWNYYHYWPYNPYWYVYSTVPITVCDCKNETEALRREVAELKGKIDVMIALLRARDKK